MGLSRKRVIVFTATLKLGVTNSSSPPAGLQSKETSKRLCSLRQIKSNYDVALPVVHTEPPTAPRGDCGSMGYEWVPVEFLSLDLGVHF